MSLKLESSGSSGVILLEVEDAQGSEKIEVECKLEWTMGEVRNAVNLVLPKSYSVSENDLVPMPWWHYAGDDVEAFAGPGDTWRLMDICFEQLCQELRRLEKGSTKVVRLRMGSLSPLGPSRAIGIMFPDARNIEKSILEECASSLHGDIILKAAQDIYKRTLSHRVLSLVISLWTLEEALRSQVLHLQEIKAVAGFGFDAELAAMVFLGVLTLEDAIIKIMATETETQAKYRALAYVAAEPPSHAHISHYIVPRAHLAVFPRDDPVSLDENKIKPLPHTLVETMGAHTPYFAATPELLPLLSFDDDINAPSFRFPFFSRGEQRKDSSSLLLDTLSKPILWTDTCRAMHTEFSLTHFLEVGRSSRLQGFLPFIFPPDLTSINRGEDEENDQSSLPRRPPSALSL